MVREEHDVWWRVPRFNTVIVWIGISLATWRVDPQALGVVVRQPHALILLSSHACTSKYLGFTDAAFLFWAVKPDLLGIHGGVTAFGNLTPLCICD